MLGAWHRPCSSGTGYAGSQAFAQVRELWGASLAAEDRVRRAGSRTAQLSRRDAANAAVEAGLLEDRFRELGPGAVACGRDVVRALRKLEHILRRGRRRLHLGRVRGSDLRSEEHTSELQSLR